MGSQRSLDSHTVINTALKIAIVDGLKKSTLFVQATVATLRASPRYLIALVQSNRKK